MKITKRIISLLVAILIVITAMPFTATQAVAANVASDSSLVLKRPTATVYVTDVTRVAYSQYSMKPPSGSNSVIVNATPSGIPQLNGSFASAIGYAGETPTPTQISFTPGVTLDSEPTISCNNTTVTLSNYTYSNGTYSWYVTGGTATVGTTLLFTINYTYTDYNSVTDKYYTRSYSSYGVSYVDSIVTPAGIYTTKRTYEDFGLGQSTKNRSYVASYVLGANTYGSRYNNAAGEGSVYFESTGSSPGWTTSYGVMHYADGHSASRDFNAGYSVDNNRPLSYIYFDRSIHSTLSDLNLRVVTANLGEASNSNERVTVSLKGAYVNYNICATYSSSDDDGSITHNTYAASEVGLTGYSGSIYGPGAAFQQYFTGSGPSSASGTYDYTFTLKYQTAADWSDVYVGHTHSIRIISYNKGALRTFIEQIQGTDPTIMTTDVPSGEFKGYNPQEWYYSSGWEAFFNAYKSALSCLKKPDVSQTEIDTIYSALVSAYDDLVLRTADYSIASAYHTQALAKNKNYYTLASWAKVQNILDNYVSNFSAIYQPAIDKVTADLIVALNSLEEATADYTEFNAHLKTVNTIMSRSLSLYGIPADQAYNNWSALVTTLTKTGCIYDELDGYVVADPLLISEQATVNGYVLQLERAINQLSLKSANYVEASKAESAYKLIKLSNLVEDSAADLTAAYNALVALKGKDLSYQSKIDEAVANLNNVIANLQYKPADVTEALNTIAKANAIDRTEYDDLSAVDTALAELQSKLDLDIRYQSEIDRATAKLQTAIDALDKKLADYTAVEEAIALVEEREKLIKDTYASTYGFTAETFYSNWSSVTAAIDNVEGSLDLTQQATVDGYAEAILNALDSLTENTADYTQTRLVYDEAYQIVSTGSGLYTEDSLDNLMSAYTSVVFNKPISEQATVDAYAQSISDAIEALEYIGADYSEVNSQIAIAQTHIDKNEAFELEHPGYPYYTEETLSEVKGAVAEVVENLDIRDQATVDAYAEAIRNAIAELQYDVADYTQVDLALAMVPEDTSDYTTLSVATLNATINNIDRTLTADKQAIVDRYVISINNAVAGLKYKGADYSAVTAAIKKVPADSSVYTEESWNYLQQQIDNVVYNLDITHQDEVDTYAIAIEQAIEFLRYKTADYTQVDNAIANANAEIEKGIYTDDSVAVVQQAIDAVERDYPVTRQSEVDAFATAINSAVAKLVQLDADYTAVDDAITAANAEIEKGYYTDDSVANLEKAINTVVRGYKVTRQAEVDAFATAIIEATQKLEIIYADYTDVDDAIEYAQSEIDTGYYTDESVAEVQEAIDAVVRDYPYTRQDEVDEFAAAIDDAVSMLKYRPADYTEVDEAIALGNAEIEKGIYTDTSVANLQRAINSVVRGYNILRQSTVDGYAAAINTAISKLEVRNLDYSKFNEALILANTEIEKGIYTDESVNELIETRTYATQKISEGTPTQELIDEMAALIVAEVSDLKLKPADYTNVEKAVSLAESEIAMGIYTDESVADLRAVIDGVDYTLLIDRQAEVDAFADAINSSIEALKLKPADYSAVTEAITSANEKIATGWYTDDSVALLQLEIEKVIYDLDITHQDEVQQFADNIVKLTNELVLKSADYTELQKILDLLDNSASEIYTNTYTNFNEVMSLIVTYREQTVSQNMALTIDKQSQVDEMAATLQGYIDSLELAVVVTERFEPKSTAVFKTVNGVNYIYGLQTNLTKAKFANTFVDCENVTLSYEMTTARYLGTGSKVIVTSELTGEVTEYIILIYGDVDGSATINSNDALVILNALSGATDSLTDVQKLAANVEGSRATINNKDRGVIAAVVAGTMTIDQVTGKGV